MDLPMGVAIAAGIDGQLNVMPLRVLEERYGRTTFPVVARRQLFPNLLAVNGDRCLLDKAAVKVGPRFGALEGLRGLLGPERVGERAEQGDGGLPGGTRAEENMPSR